MKDEIEKEKLELSLRKNEIELKERELEVYDAIMNDDIIKTFHDYKYKIYIRQNIMELLFMNVSVNKVNEGTTCVLK